MEKTIEQELLKAVKDLHEAVGTKFSDANPKAADAERTKLVEDVRLLQEQLKAIQTAKAVQKMVWSTGGKAAGEGEKLVTFKDFLNGVNRRDEKFLEESGVITKAPNGQSIQTAADGGYAVPVEYASEIVKLERQFGIARRIARIFPMGSLTRKVPRQLTQPTVTWTAEAAAHTKTKVTLDQITQTANKLSALIPMTEELLQDNNVNLDTFIFQVVAEGVAREEDNQAFAGSGSPFSGVGGVSGTTDVTQLGADLSYEDLVNILFGVAAPYRQAGRFVLDSTAMKQAMKIKNSNGDPIWSMPVAGAPGTILGKPYDEADVLTSKILFGDFGRYLWLSDRGTYEVKSSDSASDSSGKSAFELDEIWFKFRKRMDITVALPAAFSKMTVSVSA